MRPEYEFDYSKAVRGKYYKRLLKEGANVVVLERDVAKAFRKKGTFYFLSNQALWSVKVSGNWRVTFTFAGKNAENVNYEDYH